MYEGTSTSEPMEDGEHQLVRYDGDMIHIRHLCKPISMNSSAKLELMSESTMFCTGCGETYGFELTDGRAILKAV
ncbi:hypothetical protein HWC66_gp84 [Gordonia phage Chikenjars]|uniref:Uncharacterized protein n=1 Tax=Gordonia phage Chikenjars TaxID=2601686 RepID=A0A5J6D9C5_9CAUD|nr:hypothetical protein HWC66_gp84 [Gordonia phage Chikenjars]QEQ94387.1 hypothetical protein SEA_CHIKENJARS_84 [Gordonia phage Chikenjars]QXO14109.1 hypothetical protein SEA_ALAINAMARIE_85 [Gordonia phage AlainaMarie]WNN94404.1 hypothetical protein SEA_ENDAVE_86 [Gordonia phage EndAve]